MGHLSQLFGFLSKLGAVDSAVSMLRDFLVVESQWCSYPTTQWIETLGSFAKVPGVHPKDALVAAITPRMRKDLDWSFRLIAIGTPQAVSGKDVSKQKYIKVAVAAGREALIVSKRCEASIFFKPLKINMEPKKASKLKRLKRKII